MNEARRQDYATLHDTMASPKARKESTGPAVSSASLRRSNRLRRGNAKEGKEENSSSVARPHVAQVPQAPPVSQASSPSPSRKPERERKRKREDDEDVRDDEHGRDAQKPKPKLKPKLKLKVRKLPARPQAPSPSRTPERKGKREADDEDGRGNQKLKLQKPVEAGDGNPGVEESDEALDAPDALDEYERAEQDLTRHIKNAVRKDPELWLEYEGGGKADQRELSARPQTPSPYRERKRNREAEDEDARDNQKLKQRKLVEAGDGNPGVEDSKDALDFPDEYERAERDLTRQIKYAVRNDPELWLEHQEGKTDQQRPSDRGQKRKRGEKGISSGEMNEPDVVLIAQEPPPTSAEEDECGSGYQNRLMLGELLDADTGVYNKRRKLRHKPEPARFQSEFDIGRDTVEADEDLSLLLRGRCRVIYGGQARTSKIRHLASGKVYVMKEFVNRPDAGRPLTWAQLKATMESERDWLHAFRHENVLRCVAADDTSGSNYPRLVLEAMDGSVGDLYYSGMRGTRHIWKLFVSMLLALEYVHENGMIHHDLCMDNVLFREYWDQDGELQFHFVLSDFGLCTPVGAPLRTKGKLEWLPPECIYGIDDEVLPKHSSTPAVDIWSLFVMLMIFWDDAWDDTPLLAQYLSTIDGLSLYPSLAGNPAAPTTFEQSLASTFRDRHFWAVRHAYKDRIAPLNPWADMAARRSVDRPTARRLLLAVDEFPEYSFINMERYPYDKRRECDYPDLQIIVADRLQQRVGGCQTTQQQQQQHAADEDLHGHDPRRHDLAHENESQNDSEEEGEEMYGWSEMKQELQLDRRQAGQREKEGEVIDVPGVLGENQGDAGTSSGGNGAAGRGRGRGGGGGGGGGGLAEGDGNGEGRGLTTSFLERPTYEYPPGRC